MRFTTSDATGSTTSVCLSFGKRLYPYGIEPLQRFPSFIRASNTALILLLVSLAYGNRFYSIIWLRSNLFILPQALLELLLILVQPGCSGQVVRPAFPVPGQTIRRALGKGEIFFGFAWHSVPPFNLVVNKKASGLFRSLAYGIYGSLFVFCGKLFCHLQQTVDG